MPTFTITYPATTTSEISARPVDRPSRSYMRVGNPWACILTHESGGDWHDRNNPNYRGGLQFSWATWRSVGGVGDPADATPAEQMMRARMLQARSGWGQWSTASLCGV